MFKKVSAAALLCALSFTMAPQDASAFCGFYVSGGDATLYNDATQVVLMREGTRTILSMQNNYEGPAKRFAMVVPVPVVLMEQNVKTLPEELFTKIDQLTAPRLVEYWERDPCSQEELYDDFAFAPTAGAGQNNAMDPSPPPGEPKVVIEAQFEVGEYEIVILSATEAGALDTWLRDNQYSIPQGAEPLFKQYIEQGMYFFVAKVDPAKVVYEEGRAILSPLRFDYESEDFSLPVRLGMVNSKGKQDLLVNILAKGQRYEVANYPNATIPTNIEVDPKVKDDFGSFYTKLFDATIAANPKAVITEYSWDASTCDPCPGPQLFAEDFATLGADTLGSPEDFGPWSGGWVITRLHARYDKDAITDDLVFKKADAIGGGREFYREDTGELERGSVPESYANQFQGRYIVRNRWAGAVTCSDPQYGRWGGPPAGVDGTQDPSTAPGPNAGGKLTAADPTPLPQLVRENIPEIDVLAVNPVGGELGSPRAGCSSTTNGAGAPVGLLLLGLVGFGAVRRRRRAGEN